VARSTSSQFSALGKCLDESPRLRWAPDRPLEGDGRIECTRLWYGALHAHMVAGIDIWRAPSLLIAEG
jgi:hypothetical protein